MRSILVEIFAYYRIIYLASGWNIGELPYFPSFSNQRSYGTWSVCIAWRTSLIALKGCITSHFRVYKVLCVPKHMPGVLLDVIYETFIINFGFSVAVSLANRLMGIFRVFRGSY